MTIEPVFSYDAQSTGRRDVSVDEMLYLPEVVDERQWAACGNVYLDALSLGLIQCINSRLWYFVGLETDEGTVNIEK